MARTPWSADELESLAIFGPDDWEQFHLMHPNRSYDSWEVKRRRLYGGTAGRRRAHAVPAKLLYRAENALATLTEFVGAVRG